jgi:antitoxin component of MazEF toxin-antitoxin module
MTKRIQKVGNSNAIIFDRALMDMAHAKTGDQFVISLHEGGTILLTPVKPRVSRQDVSKVIKATMTDYAKTMKKLA